MAKHVNEASCAKCEEILKTAHPVLRQWVLEGVRPRHPEAHVSCAWRNEQDQNRDYAEGKSKLKWPLSNHNKFDDQGNPCSLAVDLFELASNGMACWRWLFFKMIADEAKADEAPIDWGYDLWGWDSPHFQKKP